MTDKDIIKALECMKGATANCYSTKVVNEAIDLINRQQAKIEELKIINEHLTTFNIENEAKIERLQTSKDKWKEIAIILDQSIRDKDATIEMLEEMVGDTE